MADRLALTVCALAAVIFKPLYKCFIHTLRDVNPGEAARIEGVRPQRVPGAKDLHSDDIAMQRPDAELHIGGQYRVPTWPGGHVLAGASDRKGSALL